VATDLTYNIAGWDRIKGALDEIHACHAETQNFFSIAFDQLDSLCGSLISHGQQITKQTDVRQEDKLPTNALDENRWNIFQKEFEEDRSKLHETQQSVQQQIAQLAAVTGDLASARDEFKTVHTELTRHSEELSAVREQTLAVSKGFEVDRSVVCDTQQSVQQQIAQLTAVADDLASARNEFQTVRGELARHNEELVAVRTQTLAASQELEADIKNKIREMEEEHASLAKGRMAIEKELEFVRIKASEMTELLAEQKRLSVPQQNQWAEEVHQLRTLLENMTKQTSDTRRPIEAAPVAKAKSCVAAVASGDPVLESVLAQFEILQQDRVFRNAETIEAPKNNSG
jgi:DNA repair ATPase RecN